MHPLTQALNLGGILNNDPKLSGLACDMQLRVCNAIAKGMTHKEILNAVNEVNFDFRDSAREMMFDIEGLKDTEEILEWRELPDEIGCTQEAVRAFKWCHLVSGGGAYPPPYSQLALVLQGITNARIHDDYIVLASRVQRAWKEGYFCQTESIEDTIKAFQKENIG